MLTISNLKYKRNHKVIFNRLGVTVFPGAILCVHGKNGKGKTSLLRILAALSEPAEGEIFYNQCNIRNALDEYFSFITYIAHQNSLDDDFTVYENLKFWAGIHNMSEGIQAAMSCFGLDKYSSFPVKHLSRGWQRKTELAKLLLTQSILWFLDEPFANLDEEGIKKLKEIINVRSSQNGIIIFTAQQPSKMDNLKVVNLCMENFQSE